MFFVRSMGLFTMSQLLIDSSQMGFLWARIEHSKRLWVWCLWVLELCWTSRREAIFSASLIQNKIPYKKTNKSPYQLWRVTHPMFNTLMCGGCLTKVIIHDPKKRKLEPRTVDCKFIGLLKIVQLLGSWFWEVIVTLMLILSSSPIIHNSLIMFFLWSLLFIDLYHMLTHKLIFLQVLEYNWEEIKERRRLLALIMNFMFF